MPEVTSGDVRISYDVVGQGRPLMLLHGWCCDRAWWTDVFAVADAEGLDRFAIWGQSYGG